MKFSRVLFLFLVSLLFTNETIAKSENYDYQLGVDANGKIYAENIKPGEYILISKENFKDYIYKSKKTNDDTLPSFITFTSTTITVMSFLLAALAIFLGFNLYSSSRHIDESKGELKKIQSLKDDFSSDVNLFFKSKEKKFKRVINKIEQQALKSIDDTIDAKEKIFTDYADREKLRFYLQNNASTGEIYIAMSALINDTSNATDNLFQEACGHKDLMNDQNILNLISKRNNIKSRGLGSKND